MRTHGFVVSLASLALSASVAPAAAQGAPAARSVTEQRYQIGVMERVLEGAVEHGATILRDRLQAVATAQMLILENARVRGFRLDGYGVFFDVEVPSLSGTLTWSLRTLDQNDLGLQSALNSLKKFVDSAGDVNLRQALERVQLQVGPVPQKLADLAAPPADPGARTVTGSAALAPDQPAAGQPPLPDPILDDPNEAYRAEVIKALEDAMLDHGSSLGIGADEWLTIAARRNEQRFRLAPADSDASTFVIRVRGSDLNAFRAGQISRDEVTQRIDLRVF
jgi:hypothetical protein